jgi:hypothetical protein
MSSREPPLVAAWLLNRFVAWDRKESLLGDLFEEYQAGRTAGWYWRETVVALLISMRGGIRRFFSDRRAHFILRIIRWSLAALVALGVGGGALTWASTAAHTTAAGVCSSSPVGGSCAHPVPPGN